MSTARAVIAAAAVVVLAACGSSGSGAPDSPTVASPSGPTGSAATATDLPAAAPTGSAVPSAGECYNLAAEELERATTSLSTGDAPVDCAADHNAVTVDVVGLSPEQVALLDGPAGTGAATDPATALRVTREVTMACQPAVNTALDSARLDVSAAGVSWARVASTLTSYSWLPSAEQWAAGDRWVRCDLASSRGTPLPGPGTTVDLAPVPVELGLCFNANAEGYLPLDCTDPDANSQAIATLWLDDPTLQSALASYDAFHAEADALCQEVTADRFPDAGEVRAALPIQTAFIGQLDCYVPHSPGTPPLVSQ